MSGWIGFDLDGTLAHYEDWVSEEHIGKPIEPMIRRVKHYIAQGVECRIVTARVGPHGKATKTPDEIRAVIQAWCLEHIGTALPVTNEKDYAMILLFDDRCVQVEKNTGRLLGDPMEVHA